MSDCLYLILNTVSTNAVWSDNTLPCMEINFQQDKRGHKAAEPGCGEMPRASFALTGEERYVRPLYGRTDAMSAYSG